MICPACQSDNEDTHEVCLNCGQALVGGQALTRGSVVAQRYEILSQLGKGGMGMVFKARDRVLDETVALKILRADVARAPDLERRFRSEIKLARRVRHRNVCGIHEYGEDGMLRYIAMELVEGTDLKALLRSKGALPPVEAYEVAIQLCQGLEAIHEVGVVHRDLKTSNAMLDSQGRIRLMDFGIAKQMGSEATLAGTALGNIIGTPEYMSPEQARGDRIDSRSDLYGLGVVIYELFTGHVPFHGDTPIATIFKTLEEPPTLQGPAAAGIPLVMVPVLAKALAKDPAGRYSSAREMMDAIESSRRQSFPGAAKPAPLEAATVMLSPPGVTQISRPAPTPVPTPTPQPAASQAATTILRREVEEIAPTTILAAPTPRRKAPRPAEAARDRRTGLRPLPENRRNVWPWLLIGAVVLAVAAGGIVLALQRFLTSRASDPGRTSPSPSAPALAARASARPGPTAWPSLAPTIAEPSAVPSLASVEAERPVPTPRPTPVPARPPVNPRPPTARPAPLRPSEPAALPPSPPAAEPGFLQLRVKPWAAVSIDESYVGTTPLQPLPLGPGSHTVRLNHPDYRPLQRKLTIRAGETTRLEIDMAWDGVPKTPTDR